MHSDDVDTDMTAEMGKPVVAHATTTDTAAALPAGAGCGAGAPAAAWAADADMGAEERCASSAGASTDDEMPAKSSLEASLAAIDSTKFPIPTQQMLATVHDDAPNNSDPFGITEDIDISIGCSSNEILSKMYLTEQLGKRGSVEPKHLAYRRLLVDWMCEVGEAFRIGKTTMHVAVGYLDRILQDVAVTKARLQLVALCCLLIAAKYEEAEENVPTVAVLAEYTNHAYRPVMIHRMEIMVLTRLGWKLTVVTPLHFLGLYLSKGIIFTSDTMQGVSLIPKVPRYVKKYVEFFADLTLQEYAFKQYRPSLLSAAIVAASRRALSIRPLWTQALTDLVGYNQVQLAEVFTHVWEYYLECFPAEGAAADASHATANDVMAEDLDQ